MIEKKVLGSYHVGKTIGQGAFSKVKLGVHKETGQKVAIKIIDKKQMAAKAAKAKKANEERERRKRTEREQKEPSHKEQKEEVKHATTAESKKTDDTAPSSTAKMEDEVSTPAFISALQLEVQLLMRLDHRMEFASGGELIEYIAARNHLHEKEARRFFRQLISAMDHCHLANVVHRDLKLENLLLTDNKTLIISDFGLGRTFQNDTDELMKTFCGTPNYAAVELISGIPYIGVKSDIWAMGVVLYVMMTGKPPFTGENISALYSKIKAVDYTCPDYFSPELKSLFSKILKKDPKTRIDMDGLRLDPWVNLDESEPPTRVYPKVMGPPTTAQVGQFIASITRDSECIIYTIRSHMRDGKSISGAPDKNKQGLPARRKTLSAGPGTSQRRRSSSFAPAPTNAQDLRPQPSASRSISPNARTASIKEDAGEDDVGELPPRILNNSGSLPRPSRSGGGPRRLSLLETGSGKGSPLAAELRPPAHLSLPRGTTPSATMPTPSMAPDHISTTDMGKKDLPPPQRKRRNTITQLFGGNGDGSSTLFGFGGSSHGRSSTEEPRSLTGSFSNSVENSSHAISNAGRSSVGAVGSPTSASTASPDGVSPSSSTLERRGRGRRATLTSPSADDRTLNLMRRMSMVTPAAIASPSISPTQTSPTQTLSNGDAATTMSSHLIHDPTNVSNGSTAVIVTSPAHLDAVVPSKQEIEDWHLMHRPAREIRAEVHRVLLVIQRLYDGRIAFDRTDDLYMLHCKLSEPNSENDVEFEVEVCKIWLLKIHGVRIKRLTGSAFVFKDIYASIVDELSL
ncbi:kinase-like domain-containing protein [Chytridium lagenaria]|nr:kinase-like domain-containing protein [Chytridium lagenaria]